VSTLHRTTAFVDLVLEFDPFIDIYVTSTLAETHVVLTLPNGDVWRQTWGDEDSVQEMVATVRQVCKRALARKEPWIEEITIKFFPCVFDKDTSGDLYVYCNTHEDGERVRPTLCNRMYGRYEGGRVAVMAERMSKTE
jgi:hypothetical protein